MSDRYIKTVRFGEQNQPHVAKTIISATSKVKLENEGTFVTYVEAINFVGKNVNVDVNGNVVITDTIVPYVYYVNKDGDDSNPGTSKDKAKLTIKGAMQAIDNDSAFHKRQDAVRLINANKKFIQEEVVGYIKQEYPGMNFPGGENKCKRDIGYFIDALTTDLQQGGNIKIVEAARSYYVNGTLAYITTPIVYSSTRYAYQKCKELCILALRKWKINANQLYTPLFSTTPLVGINGDSLDLSVIDEPYPSCAEVASAVNVYFQIVDEILVNGSDAVTPNGPPGITVYVASGTYMEENPITIPSNVSLIGDNLRRSIVVPKDSEKDVFYVNNGVYVTGFMFSGHVYPSAVFSFPPTGAGPITKSPYIQNCTSNTTTGCGMRVDGDLADGLKSMVLDSYTQYNQGGDGIVITNRGYAQLVSIFEICCDRAVYVNNGGTCSITNSNTDFGTYGLVADGTSPLQFTGIVNGTQSNNPNTITLRNISSRPYVGQVITIREPYYFLEKIIINDGGTGYITPPKVIISDPTGPNGISASATANIQNGSVVSIDVVINGSQFTGAPSITIEAPPSGRGATAYANMYPVFYTVSSATEIVNNTCTLTIEENLPFTPTDGDLVSFYQVSKIIASSHCFEYVGSGININTARPELGGIPKVENEVVQINGGRIAVTSTDHLGNFKIGADLTLNQTTSTLTGRSFTKSLFATMTPLILALEG